MGLRRSFFLLAVLVLAASRALLAAGPTGREPTIQPSTRGNPEELLRQGAAALQAGQTELAIQDYKAALDAAPQDPAKRGMIEFVLGIACQKAQRWQESAEALSAAVRDNRQLGYWPYLLLGVAYRQTGRLDDAIREFRRAVDLQPDNALAYVGLGNAFEKSNRLPEAAAEYAKAVELKPDYLDAYAGLASVDIQLQRLPDSWKALQAVERLNWTSTNYVAYEALATSYQTFGQWQWSVNSATKAVTLKPECAECYWLLGNGYRNLGRGDESRIAYQQALVIKPNYSAALMGLGQLAETSGDFAAAENYLDAASRSLGQFIDPRLQRQFEGNILLERGDIDRDLGHYASAFAFYTRAAESYRATGDHKDAGLTLAKVAEVYRQIGDFQASTQWYDYSLQESQKAGDIDSQITALLRLCYLARQIGDHSAQAKYWQQFESLAKSNIQDRSRFLGSLLGESFLAMTEMVAEYGDASRAIKLLEPLAAFYQKLPPNEEIYRKLAFASLFLGEAYMRVGRYDDALAAFRGAEAIAQKYNSPEIMRVYARIGDAYERQGNLSAALQYDQRAAELLEQFAAAQELPELQLSSQELAWGPYENLTRVTFELYAETHSLELLNQIFTYHEQARTRALLDLLNNAGARAREGVDPELVRQEDGLRRKIAALQNAFSEPTVSDLRKISLQQALTDQTSELRQVHERIAAANPKYEIFASPRVARLNSSTVEGK
jgi:tetratricopeptide (TPR) repeat protein